MSFGTLFRNGSWSLVWNFEFRHDDLILELKGKLQVVLINFVYDYFSLFLCNSDCNHFFFWVHAFSPLLIYYVSAHYFLRGKWCIYMQTWMLRFNSSSGYYRITCLSTYKIIILVMIIITTTIISTKKLDYAWLTSALPLIIDGNVLFLSFLNINFIYHLCKNIGLVS